MIGIQVKRSNIWLSYCIRNGGCVSVFFFNFEGLIHNTLSTIISD